MGFSAGGWPRPDKAPPVSAGTRGDGGTAPGCRESRAQETFHRSTWWSEHARAPKRDCGQRLPLIGAGQEHNRVLSFSRCRGAARPPGAERAGSPDTVPPWLRDTPAPSAPNPRRHLVSGAAEPGPAAVKGRALGSPCPPP